jgi:hypothetical protein
MEKPMRKALWMLPILLVLLSLDFAAQNVQVIRIPQNGNEVLNEFRQVLNQYPSTLRDVLRLDPALMLDENYLSLYPSLAAFLDEYPEVARNPSYFVGIPFNRSGRWIEPLAVTVIILAGILFGAWLLRTLIDYVRWNRLTKVQAEIHTKLLDRFTADQDLAAFIDTPAGRRFLESTPVQTL